MPSQALSATCAALSSRGDGARSTPPQGAVDQEQEQTQLVQWIKARAHHGLDHGITIRTEDIFSG